MDKLQRPLVMAVDDEEDIRELLKVNLTRSGFDVLCYEEASSFLEALKEKNPQVALLDLMLPDTDGIEVCKILKGHEHWKSIPVIMLTARDAESDVVLGLELGADDYVVKPFSPRELVARIKAVLRRGKSEEEKKSVGVLNITEDFYIDLNRHDVFVKGESISITKTEFTLLLTMAKNPGWVFTREQLLTTLWGDDKYVIDRTIDVHIKNLRDKLGEYGDFIKNVRGVGYKLGV